MKYLITIILTLSLPAVAVSDPILSLDPSASTIEVGESFTVDILVDDVSDLDQLLAFGFDVSSDAGIAFSGATIGSDFFDDSFLFADTDVAGSAFPPVLGDGILLATLDFTAGLTAGIFGLSIGTGPLDFGFSEGLITEFGLFDVAGSVFITLTDTDSVSVPEPSTLALLGLGLLGMGLARRRNTA